MFSTKPAPPVTSTLNKTCSSHRSLWHSCIYSTRTSYGIPRLLICLCGIATTRLTPSTLLQVAPKRIPLVWQEIPHQTLNKTCSSHESLLSSKSLFEIRRTVPAITIAKGIPVPSSSNSRGSIIILEPIQFHTACRPLTSARLAPIASTH